LKTQVNSDLGGYLYLRVDKKNPMRSDAPGILFAGQRFKVSLNQFNSHDDHAHYIRQIKKCGIKYGTGHWRKQAAETRHFRGLFHFSVKLSES